MEENIVFKSSEVEIEAIFREGKRRKGTVITHPHPLYGGNMDNGVVTAVARTLAQKDYTTLRFNFRGVGGSSGSYDNGVGEQKDVQAARAYLEKRGIKDIGLAGYSFGAWINAQVACGGAGISEMAMISPPVAFIDFESVSFIPGLKLVVTGDRDDIAPATGIEKLMPRWNPNACFETIAGADHFYSGCLDRLEAIFQRLF